MFRSSFAVKCVYAAWPTWSWTFTNLLVTKFIWVLYAYMLLQSFPQTVKKLMSSDWWAGFPCSTFEWLNQKFDRHLWSLNCFANQVLCLFALGFCVHCNRNELLYIFLLKQFTCHLLISDFGTSMSKQCKFTTWAVFCCSVFLTLPYPSCLYVLGDFSSMNSSVEC